VHDVIDWFEDEDRREKGGGDSRKDVPVLVRDYHRTVFFHRDGAGLLDQGSTYHTSRSATDLSSHQKIRDSPLVKHLARLCLDQPDDLVLGNDRDDGFDRLFTPQRFPVRRISRSYQFHELALEVLLHLRARHSRGYV
jgi:hypothetical protein